MLYALKAPVVLTGGYEDFNCIQLSLKFSKLQRNWKVTQKLNKGKSKQANSL